MKTELQSAAARRSRPELVRAIGRWTLVALVINFVIGSSPFRVPADMARLLGGASPWAYLIAAAGIGTITACFAEVASRFTGAGGPYLYTRAAFGRLVGIEMAWLAWLVRLASAAAVANIFLDYLTEFFPAAASPVPRAMVLVLLVGGLSVVNYLGVTAGARLSNVFTVAKLLPLAGIIVAGVGLMALGRTAGAPPALAAGVKNWTEAVLLLMFAYGGFEAALIPMAEAKDPRRDAPFALLSALAVTTVVYTLIQVVVMAVLPDAGASNRPLAAAARAMMGAPGAVLMALAALTSTYGYLSSAALSVPRLTFAVAERRDFPALFAAVHPHYRTPWFSILVFAVLACAMAIWGDFRWNAVLSAVARLFNYGFVCAALPVLRRRPGAPARFVLPAGHVFAALGITFSALLLYGSSAQFAGPGGRLGFAVLGAVLACGLATLLWARRHAEVA